MQIKTSRFLKLVFFKLGKIGFMLLEVSVFVRVFQFGVRLFWRRLKVVAIGCLFLGFVLKSIVIVAFCHNVLMCHRVWLQLVANVCG